MTKTKTITKVMKPILKSRPIRMWIDGKSFNIKELKKKPKIHEHSQQSGVDDCSASNEFDLSLCDNGSFSTSFRLPKIYYTKICQSKDFDIEELSKATETKITLPRHGEEGMLTIAGQDRDKIENALKEIHSVIAFIRNQQAALQFISIPLLSKEIQENFLKFKESVLSENVKGMHESIFQSHLKLHLTVTVFVLLDEHEKLEAINSFKEYHTNILKPLLSKCGPLKIRVCGLDCMNENYKKVDVLYANAKLTEDIQDISLQEIINNIAEYFYERGLLKKHPENVKIHMTLMNTKYRKTLNSPKRKWTKRESFDASTIMEKYKDYVFGECDFNEIHLSLISSIAADGFYKPMLVIKLSE